MPQNRTVRRFITAVFLTAIASLAAAPLSRSVSSSRQFIVFGETARARGAICQAGEHTKTNCLRIVQQRDDWRTPIVVNLQHAQANLPDIPAIALHVSQTGSGLKIQLDLVIGSENSRNAIQCELLRAVLVEMIYRNIPDIPAGTVVAQPPDWLLDGMIAIDPSQDKTELAEAMTSAVNAGNIISLEEFLREKPTNLDRSARVLYRAYASAFVQLLIDQPRGRARLAAYITHLSRAAENDPLGDLLVDFPGLSSSDQNEQWRAEIAKVTTSTGFRLLAFMETETKLEEMLQTGTSKSAGPGKEASLEDFLRRKISPAQAATLRGLSRDLGTLAALAHPVMRPVVLDYQVVVSQIARGHRAGAPARLARLKATRQKLVSRMSEIDDYMNWFEGTQTNQESGVFADYLKASKSSTERRRHDPISVYLDAIESEVQD